MQAQPDSDPPLAFVREQEDDRAWPDADPADAAAPAADTDEFLMHAFAGGDAAAFTRLYDRHERATWRFIRHKLGAQHEGAADDVLQETWISVARAAPRYVATARFTTWLFTVARNRVIDHLRGQANAMLSIDAPLGGSDASDDEGERWVDRVAADAADGPLARIESRQQAEAFLDALAQLPEPQREAFVLQAEGGLSIDEVASATGVGAETAKTRLRYAKARLRTLLAGWEGIMSADMPDRPDTSDDLAQAYARSHALAGGERGPAASVRANVLAAAQAVAAEAAARVAAEQAATLPLTPVAPPVAEVGRGRPPAVNLSSWRVRSGAAFCAMLLVGFACWRLDVGHRFSGEAQVALAELRMADPPAKPLPRDLPMPAMAAASVAYAAPTPVVVDPVENPSATANAAARPFEHDKNTIVAQADQADAATRARREVPLAESVAPERKSAPAPVAADATAPAAAVAAPVVVAKAAAAPAQPTEQEPTLVTIKAAPVQLATAPAMPPSVLQRRIVVAQAPAAATPPMPAPTAPAAAPRADADLARADVPQRVEVAGARPALASGTVSDSLKKSASNSVASLAGASARAAPSPLHAAAERGDVDALRKLLADPQAEVNAPDASGRSALLRAVQAQQAAAVRLLLAAGADPLQADAAGLTPRAAAQAGASAEIAVLLAAPR